RENLGLDGKPITVVAMKYDGRGHLLAEENLDRDGKLALRNGYARREYGYDGDGNCTRVASFDIDGKPLRSRSLGCEVVVPSYDKQGRMTEVAFLDANG